jgi:hypothetical protein
MASGIRAQAQAVIDRCVAMRLPSRDVGRITAAYERWQSVLGLARPVRLITDPLDAPLPVLGNDETSVDLLIEGSGGWPFPAGDPMLRLMWATWFPGTTPPVFASELGIAVGWAYAFLFSRSSAEESRTKVMADLSPLLAAISSMASSNRANLCAMALLGLPFLGLFDPPSRVV